MKREFGDYFDERIKYVHWKRKGVYDIHMPVRHVTYETFFRMFRKHGFTLRNYIDSKPVPEGREINRREYNFTNKVPYFLVFDLVKLSKRGLWLKKCQTSNINIRNTENAIIAVIFMQKQQAEIKRQKDADKHKWSLFGMLRKIDDEKIKTDLHYNELVKLQREGINAIGTGRYEETKKTLMAKEAQFYNDLADQHEKFARKGAMLSYINGGIASMDAGLITYLIAFGGNTLGIATAGIALVLAATLAAFSVRSKRLNERLAAERRDRVKRLVEEGYGQGTIIDVYVD